ncbi:MAG TPA: hypothetical protein VIN10_10875 [Bacteroidales bacterium]
MGNIFKKILNALICRFNFKVKTHLNNEITSEVIRHRLKNDPSFMEAAFEKDEFTFMHRYFLPELSKYSFLIFEGKIINKDNYSEIQIKAVGWLIILIFYYLGVLVFLYDSYIGFDEINDNPFSNPIFAFIPILLIYIYSLIKIMQVKSIFKSMLFKEEKKQLKN